MSPLKVLWFGHARQPVRKSEHTYETTFAVEHRPLDLNACEDRFPGALAAAIVGLYPGEELSFRLLKRLRLQFPQLPLIALSQHASKTEIIEAFRSGATDCVEEPIDLEGLFSHIRRHVLDHGRFKVRKIQGILQELGKKMVEAIYASSHLGIVYQPFEEKKCSEEKGQNAIWMTFFGPFGLFVAGRKASLELSWREKNMLAYLAFHQGRPIHRDRLLERFWPDTPLPSARNSLHVAMAGIRRALEANGEEHPSITCRQQLYCFQPGPAASSDLSLFLQNFQEAIGYERAGKTEDALYAYHRAFAYYRDEFLLDLEGADWVLDERDRLREKYIVVLKNLGEYFVRYEQHHFAINIFRKILEVDDCYEWAHRKLMRSYWAAGMRDQAIRQFQRCSETLDKKLQVPPSRLTIESFEDIRHDSLRQSDLAPGIRLRRS